LIVSGSWEFLQGEVVILNKEINFKKGKRYGK
jgi:hypothetical protein